MSEQSEFMKRTLGAVEAAAQAKQTEKDILNRPGVTLAEKLSVLNPSEKPAEPVAPAEPRLSPAEQILQASIDQQKR